MDLDVANVKALALLNYIRTLDFVKIQEGKDSLSERQKKAIDEGIEQIKANNSFTNEQVMSDTKERYPNLF